MGSLSIWHWLIVLLVVVLVFGTGKLRNLGKDLGGAVKGFKEGMAEAGIGENSQNAAQQQKTTAQVTQDGNTIDGQMREKTPADKA